MSIQHYNDVKAIARTADQIGASLPADIRAAIAHLETIAAGTAGAPQPGHIARTLATHLGDPAAMEKARKSAALELATAEARNRIDQHLIDTCGSRLHGLMRSHRVEITAAFGDALSSQLSELAATAALLPAWFKPTQADRITDGATFEAWTRARDAHAAIMAVQNTLGFLYAGAIAQEHAEQFPVTATQTLRFIKPPTAKTASEAYALRDALQGRVSPAREGAAHGPVSVDGVFIPTVLAHLGATFEWATPSDVTKRAEAIVAGMVREPASV